MLSKLTSIVSAEALLLLFGGLAPRAANSTQCANPCFADLYLNFDGAYTVTILSLIDGSGFLKDCDPCFACEARVLMEYTGAGEAHWNGHNMSDFYAGPFICTGTPFTHCNSDELGSMRANGPDGSARVDVYCTCYPWGG